LWTLFLLVQIASSPQYGDGAGIFGLVGGVFASRTVSGMRSMVCVFGFEHRRVVRAELERAVEQSVRVERRACADRSRRRRAGTTSDPPSPTS
jgi:hypothetical protein